MATNRPSNFVRVAVMAALVSITAVIPSAVLPATAAPAIVTDQGPLKGSVVGNVREYLGIPYAAPPLGNLRWMPPQPPAKFNGLFEATQFGNVCPQAFPPSLPGAVIGFGTVRGSENCLFLNVYTPTGNPPAHGFPVMVWIHGGSWVKGEGSDYDPARLVQKGGVIVVTINYRLGFLGFLAQTELDSEGHPSGNYGLMDQQFAFAWVRKNIGAFGGDRNRVTIFGQSAGAISVIAHLASPTAAGLFQRAISQSQGIDFQDYLPFFLPLATAESDGDVLAAAVGCGSQGAECLRAVSATTLVQAEPPFALAFPFVDGTVLAQTPDSAIAAGQFNRVPTIVGTTHDDMRLDVASVYDYAGNPLTDPNYQAGVAATLGSAVDDPFVLLLVNDIYPLSSYPAPPGVMSAPLALGALETDIYFACPSRNADILLSKYVPTYAYEFNDESAPLNFGLPPASFPLGAFHGAELQFIFNLPGTSPALSSDEQQLSDTMIGYWSHFASTGDPNFAGAPVWSPYNTTLDQFQSLVPPTPMVESNFDVDHKCSDFWDTF